MYQEIFEHFMIPSSEDISNDDFVFQLLPTQIENKMTPREGNKHTSLASKLN